MAKPKHSFFTLIIAFLATLTPPLAANSQRFGFPHPIFLRPTFGQRFPPFLGGTVPGGWTRSPLPYQAQPGIRDPETPPITLPPVYEQLPLSPPTTSAKQHHDQSSSSPDIHVSRPDIHESTPDIQESSPTADTTYATSITSSTATPSSDTSSIDTPSSTMYKDNLHVSCTQYYAELRSSCAADIRMSIVTRRVIVSAGCCKAIQQIDKDCSNPLLEQIDQEFCILNSSPESQTHA